MGRAGKDGWVGIMGFEGDALSRYLEQDDLAEEGVGDGACQ